MISEIEESKTFYELLELGCCKLCAIRCVYNKQNAFLNLEEILHKNDVEIESKKFKNNPCIVCLGLLQHMTLVQVIESDKMDRIKEYDADTFSCSISMPPSVLVREHSMRIYLESEFKDFNYDNVIPLNKVWKMFFKKEIPKYIEKKFESSDVSNFSINVIMEYPMDSEELNCLTKMQPKLYANRSTQCKKYNGEIFSRKGVLSTLQQTTKGIFKENYPVPPKVPNKCLSLKDIEVKHSPIYFAGRYLKFSRELSQSPWVIDGVRTMETSVQEIIFEGITTIFGILEHNLKFSSSGREDCDVRCLGKGRPFYVELIDPKKTKYTFSDFRALEIYINKSELIKIKHLQLVQRCELSKIKEGEEMKTKNYAALCLTKYPVTEEQINKINNYGTVNVLQKTPVRVLHRRPLAIRNRKIYEMSANSVEGKPNFIELNLNTQAGTYVKEFVHGDFGRTTPNIGEIIGNEVDIIALDVTAINLDWPTEINYDVVDNVT